MRDLKKAEKAEKRQAKVIAAELKKSEQAKIMSHAMPVMQKKRSKKRRLRKSKNQR